MAAGVIRGVDYNGVGLAQVGQGGQKEQGVVGNLMAVLSDPNASNDDKTKALELLGKLYASPKTNLTSNTIGDDSESPEEALQELLAKLKNKLAHGGKLSQQDITDLKAAQAAVSAPTTPAGSPVSI
jgi:hypothetical protein